MKQIKQVFMECESPTLRHYAKKGIHVRIAEN